MLVSLRPAHHPETTEEGTSREEEKSLSLSSHCLLLLLQPFSVHVHISASQFLSADKLLISALQIKISEGLFSLAWLWASYPLELAAILPSQVHPLEGLWSMLSSK